MTYENMLFSAGGSLAMHTQQTPPDPNVPCLILGIGTTGIEALLQVKQDVHRVLKSDGPEDGPVRYHRIRFLGIDAEACHAHGLEAEELFSLEDNTLADALRNKPLLRQEPALQWLDTENTPIPMMGHNHGGIRALGRYLLMKKAGDLTKILSSRLMDVLRGARTDRVRVFLLADLADTVGGSCYMDVCYLLRRAAQDLRQELCIQGFFFLPQVKSGNPGDALASQRNARTYAALKELDYLHNLKENGDRFTQTYDSFLRVDTQQPPVDDSFLLPMGSGACHRVFRTVGSHIVSRLAKTEPLDDEWRLSVWDPRFHPPRWSPVSGAAAYYSTLGFACRDLSPQALWEPVSCGFFEKLAATFHRREAPVSALNFAKKHHLEPGSLYRRLQEVLTPLQLAQYNKKELAATPLPPEGCLNEFWATAGNDWLDRCRARLHAQQELLARLPEENDYFLSSHDSVLGPVFYALWSMACDPEQGPRCAASCLEQLCQTPDNVLDSFLAEADARLEKQRQLLQMRKSDLELSKRAFHQKRATNANYETYHYAATQFYHCTVSLQMTRMTRDILKKLQTGLQTMYRGFFLPLSEILDGLTETFRQNRAFLDTASGDGFFDPVLLNRKAAELLETLHPTALTELVQTLGRNDPAATQSDPRALRKLVSDHLARVFPRLTELTCTEMLTMSGQKPGSLDRCVEDPLRYRVFGELLRDACPAFPFLPEYPRDNLLDYRTLQLPSAQFKPAARDALSDIGCYRRDYHISRAPEAGQFLCFHEQYPFPLYAYGSLLELKQAYDADPKLGIHLHRDWQKLLPEPLPLSAYPELVTGGEAVRSLLTEAHSCGALAQTEDGPVLYLTRPVPEDDTDISALYKDDRPDHTLCLQALEAFSAAVKTAEAEATPIALPWFREDPEQRLLVDRLLLCPKLLRQLQEEVDRRHARAALARELEQVYPRGVAYDEDLRAFCELLCFGLLVAPEDPLSKNPDTTALVFCRFINDYKEPVEQLFSSRTDAVGREFALFAAFTQYRTLSPYATPREDLLSALEELQPLPQTLQDHCIAWNLTRRLDGIMSRLTTAPETRDDQTARDIRRFYTGLRRHLAQWQNNAPCWPDEITGPQLQPKLRCLPDHPRKCCHVLDPKDGKILTYYPATSRAFVYDPQTDESRLLRRDMKVWDGKQWADPAESDVLFF